MISRMLVLTVLSFLSLDLFAQTTATYYLKVKGDSGIAQKLIAELSSQECHTMAEISGCHAFRKYENDSQIQGKFPKPNASYLYKISLNPPQSYNLQIFERDGKKLRRILNAGNFQAKVDFYSELVRTTKTLTFK
jgi:hypothetical protein